MASYAGNNCGHDDRLQSSLPAEIIDITNEGVAASIRDMVTYLWETEHSNVGHGIDVHPEKTNTNNVINITKIERIQNQELYFKYNKKREEMIKKLDILKKKEFKPLTDLLIEKGIDSSKTLGNRVNFKKQKSGIATTDVIAMYDSKSALTVDMRHELNEHYLFHGTKPDNVISIATSGLSTLYSKDGMRLFGKGVYLAENPVKADQYTDGTDPFTHENKKIFLARVCLGELYITSERLNIDTPVCRTCGPDCEHEQHDTVDSTIGIRDGKYREFVVYRDFQCYPEYVITYSRDETYMTNEFESNEFESQ